MSTITRDQLTRYENEGWRVIGREGSNVTLEKESHIAEDVGRSIGYTVTAPVVFALSLAGSVLAVGCGACCCVAGGTVIKEEGTRKYAVYDPKQAKFTGNMAEGCCLEVPCTLVTKMNKGFFDWAEPFQSTTRRRTFTLISEHND